MINTLSNTELEIEYIVSCLLSQDILPKEYISLKLLISGLKIIDTSDTVELMYDDLLKLRDKFDMLSTAIDKFYKGTDEKLLIEFVNLQNQIQYLIPFYNSKVEEEFNFAANKLYNQIPGSNFMGIGSAIDSIGLENAAIQIHNQTVIDLQKQESQLSQIIELYGSGNKISYKHRSPKWNSEYKIYLQSLQTEVDQFTDNPDLAMTLGKAIDSIGSLNPIDSQDPYSMDLLENLLMVLCNPKDFYKDCKIDKIISEVIGKLFYHVYPEFFSKFLDMYMDDYLSLNYTQQQNFKKCFGMSEDTTQLINTLAPTMVFTAQGAQ